MPSYVMRPTTLKKYNKDILDLVIFSHQTLKTLNSTISISYSITTHCREGDWCILHHAPWDYDSKIYVGSIDIAKATN